MTPSAAVLDLTAPDLAAPLIALEPVFPLVIHTSQLVLETGAPGEILVHWHLDADEYLGVGHAFPPSGGAPIPALRLRRLHPDGGSEAAAEVRLALTGTQGDGEREFTVGLDAAQFEAELGLTNDDGGWMLLARSNRLAATSTAPPPAAVHTTALPLPPLATPAAPQPDAAPAPKLTPASLSELALELSFDPHLDPPLTALEPVFPLPKLAQPPAPAAPRIPTLIYGRAIQRHAGLLIEAELRIHGSGEPNSEIDLFGQRYFIGAGGRFQLLIQVDDPALLTQALLQHPPPELTRLRPE